MIEPQYLDWAISGASALVVLVLCAVIAWKMEGPGDV
jgi:hypothetical protein